jgi:putative transposase
MPRRSRVVLAGVAQHVTQRGNDRQAVFLSSADHRLYLELLARHASGGELRMLGYCLMTNHVHLVVVPEREDSLARVLGRTHGEYAQAFNRSSGRSGHVWQNRFFSCLLDEAGLAAALRYVDLNPVRAGVAAQAWSWPWSSAAAHVDGHAADAVLDPNWQELVGRWNGAEWREILAAGVDPGETEALRRATCAGEPFGGAAFLARLETEAGRRLKVLPRGRPKKEEPTQAGQCDAQRSLFASGG